MGTDIENFGSEFKNLVGKYNDVCDLDPLIFWDRKTLQKMLQT